MNRTLSNSILPPCGDGERANHLCDFALGVKFAILVFIVRIAFRRVILHHFRRCIQDKGNDGAGLVDGNFCIFCELLTALSKQMARRHGNQPNKGQTEGDRRKFSHRTSP